jgi:hypothetical protein
MEHGEETYFGRFINEVYNTLFLLITNRSEGQVQINNKTLLSLLWGGDRDTFCAKVACANQFPRAFRPGVVTFEA